jgi:sulfatase modifying factor 1
MGPRRLPLVPSATKGPMSGSEEDCCAPGRAAVVNDASLPSERDAVAASGTAIDLDLVALEGGTFIMGTDDEIGFPADGEGPIRAVTLRPFRIARCSVSNRQFAQFVDATGYTTEAERYGWSFVFHMFLPDDFEPTRAVASAQWWRQVYGADWRHPAGPQSDLDGVADHPVGHISWNDATAYCEWASVRLPTEAEWEYAARGGLVQNRYAWGDDFALDGQTMCNIFEGSFPVENTADDGYVGTAPVASFPPNGYGLHNVAGNVWEWCADWFHTTFHRDAPTADPAGPPGGEAKVMRGGSYLCHDSYCNRYRVAARSSNTLDSSTANLGFRVAADAEPDENS